jgi:HK97 gp10 family phage protein
MASTTVNLNKLSRKLDTMFSKRVIERGIQKGCLRVEASAKLNAPVDTGNLRASITTDVQGLQGEVGTNVEYAAYMELGTSKMKAHPYLYPALAENKDKIVKDISDSISKGV